MHTYSQSSGVWTEPAGAKHSGYSGFDPDPSVTGEIGEGKNDPSDQAIRGQGPIPVGLYKIGLPHFHPTTGPCTMRLHPQPGTNTYGRTGFLVHGDSSRSPGQASHGCIVLPRHDRMDVAASGDEDLQVVP